MSAESYTSVNIPGHTPAPSTSSSTSSSSSSSARRPWPRSLLITFGVLACIVLWSIYLASHHTQLLSSAANVRRWAANAYAGQGTTAGAGGATCPPPPEPIVIHHDTNETHWDDGVALIIVSDPHYQNMYAVHLMSLQCYAKKHGYTFLLLDPSKPEYRVACALRYRDFFFRKHCVVQMFLANQPRGYTAVVFDGDTLAGISGKNLDHWLLGADKYTDVIFMERDWNYEITAGIYAVRNTEFGLRFLQTWADFEYQVPQHGFHSSDNGAIHLVMLQVIGFHDIHTCFDLYHRLDAPVQNLHPYYAFVACTRRRLGPSRRWKVVEGPITGTITIWNRFHGWSIDGWVVNHRAGGDYHTFHHGSKKISEVQEFYNFSTGIPGTDYTKFSFDPPIPMDYDKCGLYPPASRPAPFKDLSELGAFLYISETGTWFRGTDGLGQVPRWPMDTCIKELACYPLADDEIVKTVPSSGWGDKYKVETEFKYDPKKTRFNR